MVNGIKACTFVEQLTQFRAMTVHVLKRRVIEQHLQMINCPVKYNRN